MMETKAENTPPASPSHTDDEAPPIFANDLPLAETRQHIEKLQKLLELDTPQLKAWQQALDTMEGRLREHIVRLAVIGTIKSGKSSLINAFLKQDLLKRGAGILTAIITRIRYGPSPCARIRFKSWTAIQEEVQNAFAILAQAADHAMNRTLEFRKPEDREFLRHFLEEHSIHFSEHYESLNQERILLQSFLQGYNTIHEYLEETESFLLLEAKELGRHQEFVSREEYAVYMQDIQLDVPAAIVSHLEIADCQGSDSPNPHHFAMVQKYLAQCSMVLYVVSSRTGIRQADLVLLKTLQQLELLHCTVFVSNLDLNEHESLEDAQRVLRQSESDLKQWVAHPQIFAVSALFQLFSESSAPRSPRVNSQLQLWETVPALIHYHRQQWYILEQTLTRYMVQQASELLRSSERSHWHYLIQKILEFMDNIRTTNQTDYQQLQQFQKGTIKHREALRQASYSLQITLEGALEQVKQQLSTDIDQLFNGEHSPIVLPLYQFIQTYELPLTLTASTDAFSIQIAVFYKTLQRQLVSFVTEELNAPLIRNLKALQQHYLKHLQKVCSPFFNLLQETLQAHLKTTGAIRWDCALH